jgi:PAS domain S-box-containing protein/putative nucleotidyltransferase with HDIG domain
MLKIPGLQSVYRVVLYYLLFGIVWLVLSESLLALFARDPIRLSFLQTYKGWAFVFFSSLFIYITIRHELRKLAQAEADLLESEEKYRTLIETDNDAVFIIDAETGIILDANKKADDLLGMPHEKIIGMHQKAIHPEEYSEQCSKILKDSITNGGVVASDVCVFHRSGRNIPVEVSVTIVERGGKRIIQSFFRDITKRKHAEDLAKERLQRLAALHAIDMIISSSLDLRVTLSEFLDLVIAQLRVDAAAVLLLNPHTQSLEFSAGRGFSAVEIQRPPLRLGEGIAGLAALEHRSISIPNLLDPASGFPRAPFHEREGFITYAVVPLMAKGHITGVLEVYHRARLVLDLEWLNFLEALAAQAAIAIDNATLFNELQRSTIEITVAYDATLEGWAHALDLRSQATEQHTQRVTEMTTRLARSMGVSEKELVHIRRGALLHDIGKIGIPDSILLKPGPLTDEEWTVMRKHPQYAFDMLQPIAYLRPALDIPYAHHEQWDGSGYPRSLKGEQIPLAARIFSVADVWDAMTDEQRPYRNALSKEEVREYIRALAGNQLDPNVVAAFLKIAW